MPKPKLNRQRVVVQVDNDVCDELEMYILDPVTGKIKYGAISSIANHLFRAFLKKLKAPGVDPVVFLEAYGVDMQKEQREVTASRETNLDQGEDGNEPN